MSLWACPECNRHIRTSETACPFCGAAVAEAIAKVPPRILPTERLSRAAMMAFAAASLGATACGGETSQDPSGTGGELGMPLYGAPFVGGSANAGGTASTGGEPSAGGIAGTGGQMGIPVYGAPFFTGGATSAGGTTSAGVATSAGGTTNTGGFVPVPLYGAPFFTGGATAAGGTSATGGTASAGGAAETGGATAATGGTAGFGGLPVPAYGAPFRGVGGSNTDGTGGSTP